MKLLFRQRLFSWFDSYDIYAEDGSPIYEVRGKLSWGHRLEIYDRAGTHLGTVKEEILTLLPRFALYVRDQYMGEMKKEFTLFRPRYHLNCNGWTVQGDMFAWDYEVTDPAGLRVMTASKQLLRMTDTYVIDVPQPENALIALMIVLAIDAANCSK